MNSKPDWKVKEDQRHLAMFDTDVDLRDGVPYWKTNGRVPPWDIVQLWAANDKPVDEEAASKARDEQQRQFIAEYRKAQARRTPEQIEEERAMARAAHGPGVEMVNVFTGERYRT